MNRMTVALVSDEPTFCYVATNWLESAGYRVITARDEQECGTLRDAEHLAALIIEVTADTGFSASRVIDTVWADSLTSWLPVVVCSADPGFYTWQAQYLASRGCRILGKPLARETLLDVVHAVVVPQTTLVLPDALSLV